MKVVDKTKRARRKKLKGRVLTSSEDEKGGVLKKRGRKKQKVEFAPNLETLSLNAFETRNAIGIPYDDGMPYPDDFFTHPDRYRKK